MKHNLIELLLEKKIGLDSAAIGQKAIEKAIHTRMERCGATSLEAYAETLNRSNAEWQHLIEMVAVPETWFFRNRKAFHYFVHFVADEWFPKNPGRPISVLSLPCSTGEEPYSIAMAFLDAGISVERFRINGLDISEKALKRAQKAVYGQASFRGQDLVFRDRYFQVTEKGYQLLPPVKDCVHFKRCNVLEYRFSDERPYDAIFCRNLLIYMSEAAKARTLETMRRLLSENGILFCGHAERQAALEWGFEAVNASGVFACRKRCQRKKEKGAAIQKTPVPSKQERRPPQNQEKMRFSMTPSSTGREGVPKDAKRVSGRIKSPLKPKESDNAVDSFLKARSLADQGRLSEALELCEVFLNENPVYADAHFLMGLIYEASNDDERAEASFNRAIYLNPEHVPALNHMALILLQRGNRTGAERLRARVRRIDTRGMDSEVGQKQKSGMQNGK